MFRNKNLQENVISALFTAILYLLVFALEMVFRTDYTGVWKGPAIAFGLTVLLHVGLLIGNWQYYSCEVMRPYAALHLFFLVMVTVVACVLGSTSEVHVCQFLVRFPNYFFCFICFIAALRVLDNPYPTDHGHFTAVFCQTSSMSDIYCFTLLLGSILQALQYAGIYSYILLGYVLLLTGLLARKFTKSQDLTKQIRQAYHSE